MEINLANFSQNIKKGLDKTLKVCYTIGIKENESFEKIHQNITIKQYLSRFRGLR